MEKSDRRVLKTKKALHSALAELLNKKELHQITVKELVDAADVHRATFYTHYQDIFELYGELEETILSELKEIMTGEVPDEYESIHELIVDYVFENSGLANIFFGGAGSKSFRQKVCSLLEEEYLEMWRREDGLETITDEMRYITAYQIRGSIEMISRWIDNDFDISKAQLVDLVRRADMSVDYI